MAYVMVDIESDGPIPGDYSMVSFGAVIAEPGLSRTFYGKLRPISEKWIAEALKVSGFNRDDVLKFDDPAEVMRRFDAWLKENVKDRPMFYRRQQWLRLAIHQLVLPPLSHQEPIWVQFDEPRFSLQG